MIFGVDIAGIVRHVLANEQATALTSGALVLAVLTWIGYQARALPMRLIALIEQQFTVSLVIQGDDYPFHKLTQWLAKHPWTRKSRRLSVVTFYDMQKERNTFDLTPGPGRHFLREDGRFFMVHREMRQAGQSAAGGDPRQPVQPSGGLFGRQESITLTIFGRSPKPFQRLLEKLDEEGREEKLPLVPVCQWSGSGYNETARRPKRPIDTVYLDEAIKREIITDVEAFLARRQWYAERGIPWRRGWALNGPPGTGKTTLIFAIASHFDMPVFTINPSTIWSDDGLMAALNYPQPKALFVIEDIDSVEILKARPNIEIVHAQDDERRSYSGGPAPSGYPSDMPAYATVAGGMGRNAAASQLGHALPTPSRSSGGLLGGGITLSGFLNAMDGLGGADGRLLFVTTNCPDDLDPALTRAGRIDKIFHLGPAGVVQARAMFQRFFPDADATAFVRAIEPELPMAQAHLQNLMLQLAEAGDPVAALQAEIQRRFAA